MCAINKLLNAFFRISRTLALTSSAIILTACASHVAPATYIVSSGDVPQLIEAINRANARGSMTTLLLSGRYELTRVDNNTDGPNGLPSITGSMVLDSFGAVIARAQNAEQFRIFHIATGGNLTLNDLGIENGSVENLPATNGSGGGILNRGSLSLDRVVISNNVATLGGGLYNYTNGVLQIKNSRLSNNSAERGGGLNNLREGIVDLSESSIIENHAEYNGGGVDNFGNLNIVRSTFATNSAGNGGGISNSTRVEIVNSTFSGNTAQVNGGGLFNDGVMNINSTTIAGNSAILGGGLFNRPEKTLTIKNSILAYSPTGGNCNPMINSRGHNLSSDSSCSFSQAGDLSSVDPLLEPLSDNGGATRTHALPSHSPAVNVGDCGQLVRSMDQRGMTRVFGTACDMGAYEWQGSPLQPAPR